MSLKTDAETISSLSDQIKAFENANDAAKKPGATVIVSVIQIKQTDGTTMDFNCVSAGVTLNASQKTALFAAEDAWKASIKSITAAW